MTGSAVDPAAKGTWPKEARLRRRAEFLAVQGKGRRWSGRHLTVWYAVQTPGVGEIARVGLTVSRKVGGSVVRNQVRRRLREAFRRTRHRLPLVDLVCIARPSAADAGWDGLSGEVERVVRYLEGVSPVGSP
jgi:ribonuclease P protein component